jgi:hypothetical protein
MAKVDGAEWLLFQTIDYGTITQRRWTTQFVLLTMTKPLIITNTQGSCGCTVPTSPKSQLLRAKVLLV